MCKIYISIEHTARCATAAVAATAGGGSGDGDVAIDAAVDSINGT